MNDTDSQLDHLYAWLRDHPEEWPDTECDAMSEERMRELTNRIIDREAPSGTGTGGSVISLTAKPPRNSTSRRRRRVAIIAAPIIVIALAAATWAVTRTPASNGYSLSCNANGVTTVITNDGAPPLEACAKLWRTGVMKPDVHTAPPLVACVSHGAVAVIPGRGAADCTKQHMTLWAGQADSHDTGSVARSNYKSVGAAVQSVRYALFERFKRTGNYCATEHDWRSQLAAQPALHDWTIALVAPKYRGPGPCFDLADTDLGTHTIRLIPMGDQHSFVCAPPKFPC